LKFNVIIGNPPYNNDLYIDFCLAGLKLAKQHNMMIIPAKWQSKPGEQNELFREKVVPHMKKIAYYVNPQDIFSIDLSGGICYYLTNNGEVYDTHHVKVHKNNEVTVNPKWIPSYIKLDFSDKEKQLLDKITSYQLLDHSDAFQPYVNFFGVPDTSQLDQDSRLFNRWHDPESEVKLPFPDGRELPINKYQLKNWEHVDKYKLIMSCQHFKDPEYGTTILKPGMIPRSGYATLCIGSLEECKSANSFYGNNLIQWLTKGFFSCAILSNNTNAFRFVPYPGPFDHIFTNEELYRKFKLTDEEIDIIESSIKHRKSEQV